MNPQPPPQNFGSQQPPNPQVIDTSYAPYNGYGYTGGGGYYPTVPGGYNPSGYGNYYGYGGYGYGKDAVEFLSPRRLLKVIRRRWFLIILLTLIGAVGAVLYFWKAERVFEAKALIEMSVRGQRILNDVVSQDVGQSSEVFNTRLGRLRGDRFGMLAEERFKLLWEARGRPLPGNEIPNFAAMSYDLIRMSRLVQFKGRANDPMVAWISVNAAAEAAEAFFQEENQERSNGAVQWLDKQAETQKQVLTRTEDILLAFRTENNLDTLEAGQEADRQSLLSLNQMLVAYDNELLRAQEYLKAVEVVDIVNMDLEQGVQLPGSLPNRDRITSQIQLYRNAQLQKEGLLEVKTELHPDVVQLDREIRNLEESIRGEILEAKTSFNQQINVIQGQRAAVVARISELTGQVTRQELRLVGLKSRLNTLERERDAALTAYQGLLQRIELARLSADEDTATLVIVERASLPKIPVHPRLMVMLPVGVMAGLGFGFLLALALEAAEDRIFSIAELEAGISSRIIGIIPHISGGKRQDLALISLNQRFGQVAEAFNAVRVLMDHVNNNRLKEIRTKGHAHPGGQVIMFCSASPSEGKTVSATNVAVTTARAGQRCLLIDCDMRRPRLAKVFEDAVLSSGGKPEDYSLLHHLAKSDDLDFGSIVLPGPTEHLHLMASVASMEINPADLLGGDKIRRLVLWARKHYDRVIIDTPPIGIISDGLVISGLSDGVVVVCRTGQTRHRALRHVLLQFKGVGASVLGIIVNDFNMRKAAEPLDVHYKDFASGYAKSDYAKEDPKTPAVEPAEKT